MFRPIHASFVVLLVSYWVCAQQPAGAQEVPFVAEVIDQTVSVRGGAGRSFYVVGQLKKGQEVTVDEVVFGWYKIEPPEGSYSYISRAFVDAFGDGKSGKINTQRAPVRAASVDGVGDSYRRQIDLIKGDTVQIVGEEGSFYKIVPPNNAYVFLPPGSVRPVATESKLAATTAAPWKRRVSAKDVQEGLEKVHDEQVMVPDTGVVAATGDEQQNADTEKQPDDPQAPLRPVSEVLKAAEQKLIDAQQLPLEQRPIQALMKEYKAMASDATLTLVDSRIVAMRVAQLRKQALIAKTLQGIVRVRQEHQNTDPFVDQLPSQLPKKRYDLRGHLRISGVYNGTNLPRLYRVTETDDHRVIAYARLNPILDPAIFLGHYVGIVGQMKYDPELKLEVIEAQHIDRIGQTAAR